MSLLPHAPNQLQVVRLEWIEPNPENVRLFIERVPLHALTTLYKRHAKGEDVILPDAPVVRYMGRRENGSPRLVLLAGERRTTAAKGAGLNKMLVRVVRLSDDDAYRFILQHNNVAGLTTLEIAFRALEMERLGFDRDEISRELGGVALHRYLAVGACVNPDLFTDAEKLCNPSIVEWYEATEYGQDHFDWCFKNWNDGLWNEEQCTKHFRKRGEALPMDNAEKGFRVTFSRDRLVVRGQADLNVVDNDTAIDMLYELEHQIREARWMLTPHEVGDDHRVLDFGPRTVHLINPLTLYDSP